MLTNIFEMCLLKTSATTSISVCKSSSIKLTNSPLTLCILSCLLTVIRYLTGGLFEALTNVKSKNIIHN